MKEKIKGIGRWYRFTNANRWMDHWMDVEVARFQEEKIRNQYIETV